MDKFHNSPLNTKREALLTRLNQGIKGAIRTFLVNPRVWNVAINFVRFMFSLLDE